MRNLSGNVCGGILEDYLLFSRTYFKFLRLCIAACCTEYFSFILLHSVDIFMSVFLTKQLNIYCSEVDNGSKLYRTEGSSTIS